MSTQKILTCFSDLFFIWILFHFGLGDLENAWLLFTQSGIAPWAILCMVVFFLLYHSDYRTDIPLFIAGIILGYWGEWWGTTRGIWTYWNGAIPPDYLPPIWGIGLLTVYRFGMIIKPLFERKLPNRVKWIIVSSFFVIPVLAFARSLPVLTTIDWSNRLDIHFVAGFLVAVILILYRFELGRDFPLYLCGTLLGGLYEFLGTSMGEWWYITAEVPPLWIAPLWGLATIAMSKLALLVRQFVEKTINFILNGWQSIRAKGQTALR